MNMNTHTLIGAGKDGVVVFPPLPCSATNGLANVNEKYVGKIYYKGRDTSAVQSILERLPDEFDGILYFKENYVCDGVNLSLLPPPTEEISYALRRLTQTQMVLRRVYGSSLSDALEQMVMKNDNCAFVHLFACAVRTYIYLHQLAEKGVYYNDFSSSNLMYSPEHKAGTFMLVDLDDITFGTPLQMHRSVHATIEKMPHKYGKGDGNMAYKKWEYNYVESVFQVVLDGMAFAYSGKQDNYLVDSMTADERAMFDVRKKWIEKWVGKPIDTFERGIEPSVIESIASRLDAFIEEGCRLKLDGGGSGSGSGSVSGHVVGGGQRRGWGRGRCGLRTQKRRRRRHKRVYTTTKNRHPNKQKQTKRVRRNYKKRPCRNRNCASTRHRRKKHNNT